ncbi:xanthine dehydrogenase family protein subunit M [Streptacidiphilus sp. EB129]|uniref:FAD binding domain-containing protein n=1 Tax=Streptacidiphilus sp. EB129 TaxID=3156262 RepID=UPI003513677C
MKLPQIEYRSPVRLCDAVDLLAGSDQEAVPLAGGQSLIPLLAARARRPRVLVGLDRIDGLSYLTTSADFLEIGAMTRQRTLETDAAAAAPLLAAAAARTGHVSVRNRGTLGGTVAFAAPGAELLTAAVALDARLRLTGPGGDRECDLRSWITGPYTTGIAPGELVVGIRVPLRRGRSGQALQDLSHPIGGRPVACVAAVIDAEPDGTVRLAEITVSSRASAPTVVDVTARLADAEEAAAETVSLDGPAIAVETNGPPAAYCRDAARVLTRRALSQAITRARLLPEPRREVA